MTQEDPADTRDSTCRDERIWQIVNECLLRRENGESVSDESIIEQHPELMPELGAHLRNLHLIQKAGRVHERATAGPSKIARSGVQGLQVRCPHCRCSVEVVIDTPLAEITCSSCGSTFSLVGDETLLGTWDRVRRIAQFELLERLGVGGFGTVWKARDTELDRMVAVKIPRARHLDPAQVEMFFREARAAAQLNHPSIVNVHEVGREGETIYIVTDLAQGIPLSDWIKSQPYTPHDAAELCRKIAQALHHAHEKGIIHRDLKPHNIMIDGDLPQLMDFGLARREAGEITMTIDGQVLGTPAYMSPEQAKGEAHRADRRSDIYSLGVVFYELLTGELPFRGNARMLIQQVVHDQAPSPRRLNGNVPRDLETICLRCLEKELHQRYSTAEELSAELGRFLKGEPIHSRSVTALGRAWRWCKRYPAVSSLGAALLVVLLSGLAGVTTQWFRADLERQLAHEHRDTANRHLYQALVDQARALRLARAGGYRGEVFGVLKQALAVDTPVKNVDELRQAAIACMGDFVGLEPTVWDDFPAEVWQIASRPRTAQLAIGLTNGTVVLRDLASGRELANLSGHSSPVGVLAFGPRGKILASGHNDGTILLWREVAHDTWSRAKTFFVHQLGDGIDALAIDPDGRRLLVSHDLGSRITTHGIAEESDGAAPIELRLPNGAASTGKRAFSPDGTLLATGRERDGVYDLVVWDIAKRQILRSLETGLGAVKAVAFSRDGSLVACACADGAALFDSTKQWARTTLPGDVTPSVVLCPNNAQLAISAYQLGLIRLWSVRENREVAVLTQPDVTGKTHVVFSQDGKRVVAAGSQSIRIWTLAGATEKLIPSGHKGGVPGLAFSPDGTRLASGGKDHTVRLLDPITGNWIRTIELTGQVQAVAFSPDGRMLATGDWSGAAQFWDVSSGQLVQRDVDHHLGPIWSVAFSPNGEYFAASGNEGAIIWPVRLDPGKEDEHYRLTRGTPVQLTTAHVTSLVFSLDSKLLAWAEGRTRSGYTVGHVPGTVHIWDLDSGQELLVPPQQTFGRLYCMAFHPNSKLLTIVSRDKAAEVWDVSTRQRTLRYASREHLSTDGVRLQGLIALSGDGRWAARNVLTDLGQALTIWDLERQKLLLKLPEEHGAIWAFAWSPDRELLAVSTSTGGPVIWNIPKIRGQLAELGLDW